MALAVMMALATLAPSVPARAAARLVEEPMMCPVLEVSAGADGVLLVRIGRGEEHGIPKGAKGDLFARGAKTGIGPVVGRAEVIEVSRSEALARVIPGSFADQAQVRDAFQLELRALVPVDVHRGPLFELYLRNIEFLDNQWQPLLPPGSLLRARQDGRGRPRSGRSDPRPH
jgi:hypothetical protein